MQLSKEYPYSSVLVVSDRNSIQIGLGGEFQGWLQVRWDSYKQTVSLAPEFLHRSLAQGSSVGVTVATWIQADFWWSSPAHKVPSLLITQAKTLGLTTAGPLTRLGSL